MNGSGWRYWGERIASRYLVLVYAFLYAPILMLMLLSLNKSGLPTVWSGVSFAWYHKLFQSSIILNAAKNTLIVAVFSTLLSGTIGTLLAFGVERGGPPSNKVEVLLFAPMVIPDIVLAIALLSFFTLLQFTLGLHSIVISHTVFNIAFVCAVVRTRLKHFDYAVIEASHDLGAGVTKTFVRVTLPIIFPGVLAASLLAFTLSVDEFIIAYFTAGVGQASTTLPMHIYSMIRFGVTPEINAMATIVMLFSFTLLFFSQRIDRKAMR